MDINTMNAIDAALLQKMFLAGASRIEAKKEYINELNVFPVPDGDTGTNMSLTIIAAAKEVGAIAEPNMQNLAKAISSGSLRGARGNSGVILSQLFRGFTKEISKHETLDVQTIAAGFQKAVETAYKAVMKPKEGTILTVARGAADKALEMAGKTDNIVVLAEEVIRHANDVLSQTPEMLPVLKEAGVVDSGGQGLMEVLQGAVDAMLGKEVKIDIAPATKPVVSVSADDAGADIKFGYCTEFIINLEKEFPYKTEMEFKKFLSDIGDSIVVVSDDEIVKVHVHTNHPGEAFEKALTYGSLSRMKIDNMREEHQEKLIKEAEKMAAQQETQDKDDKMPHKDMGFIAVSIGEGVNEIFTGLGVDYIIEGGQTMNPSTEDMLNAIEKVNADHVFILPNNKNIILAAQQAKALVEDKDIIVVPTKTIPQGISAMINFVPEEDASVNEQQMLEGISHVKTGQITYAVRDTSIDGKEIKLGDIMGIGDAGIEAVGHDINGTTLSLIKELTNEDSELICLYYGEDISKEDAKALTEKIEELYPDCDVELQYGGQPIYYYVLSVE